MALHVWRMNMKAIRYLKLAAGLLGIIIFYITIHEHSYHILFRDKVFHGLPYSNYTDLLSVFNKISLKEDYSSALEKAEKDKPGEKHCIRSRIVIEIKPERKMYRSVVIFSIFNEATKLETDYYYSPKDKKLWHLGLYPLKHPNNFPRPDCSLPDSSSFHKLVRIITDMHAEMDTIPDSDPLYLTVTFGNNIWKLSLSDTLTPRFQNGSIKTEGTFACHGQQN